MNDTYLVEFNILRVEACWCQMVPIVPRAILKIAIVCIVKYDLILGNPLARPVLKASMGQFEDLLRVFAPQRRVTLLSRDRWPHVLEYHDVLARHLCCLLLFYFCEK